MAYERLGEGALDYSPCHYGASKLVFRGPPRQLEGAYVAVLGGTETYGRFIARPYPALIEAAAGLQMVNLGCVNAGVDAFLNDPDVLAACRRAQVTVVQVLGAQNMSNRYYSVHPRRNDRFFRAAPPMRALFREVDFTEFSFTRHMLSSLQALSPDRFAVMAAELQGVWVARMNMLLARLETRAVLLWIGDRAPPEAGAALTLDHDPLLIDRVMVEALRPRVAAYVEVVTAAAAMSPDAMGMALAPEEMVAATGQPGPAVHDQIARALAPVLRGMV